MKFFIPEVIQTSAMDCGPAALKALLEGFDIPVSYGRLREACQTDVDGTSINTLELVANQLGLEAEQIMLPGDHLLIPEARALPAIIVVKLPNGVTHFEVGWRSFGGFIQLMDPATGRKWVPTRRFLDELYLHSQNVPASSWRQWAGQDDFLVPLRRRCEPLGLRPADQKRLIEGAQADPTWRSLAALDASVRLTHSLIRSRGISCGPEATRVLARFFERSRGDDASTLIPPAFWSVLPAPSSDSLILRGAVLVRALRKRTKTSTAAERADIPPPSAELAAALREPPTRPSRELLKLLATDGFLTPTVLIAALFLSALGVLIENLLFRGLLDLAKELDLVWQRYICLGGILGVLIALVFLRLPIIAGIFRLGRRIESRLRIAFLEKIPRLRDRYFQSRLSSDMAERCHSVHRVRDLSDLASRLLGSLFQLLLTTLGLIWLDPGSAWIAAFVAIAATGIPLLVQPILSERNLRFRTHGGVLSRFYFDTLLGLVPIRTHGAEKAIKREHEALLVEWIRAGFSLQRVAVAVDGALSLIGFALGAWLLIDHLNRGGAASTVFLFSYWALRLPTLGQEIAQSVLIYPTVRNITLRLLEPLAAPEETGLLEKDAGATTVHPIPAKGVDLVFDNVTVVAAGHTILNGISCKIPAGSHVAVVGPSGAGKSSLVGLLLGWHRAAAGQTRADGKPLNDRRVERLRRQTAWVDPAVHLWNRPLMDNLRYGNATDSELSLAPIIEAADLRKILERLPSGLQTSLGEGGALVSGGEGQRVRLARAMLRGDTRLVILDEPFRGLDREKRKTLLSRARELWRGVTLLCITHDVGETTLFDRVLVIERGKLVEDAPPQVLAEREGSRYRTLLTAEEMVREGMWSNAAWRRLWLEDGRLSEHGKR